MSLINTINSIVAVDLDAMAPLPTVDGKGTHGGYCGPAVKPIALNMVAEIARDAGDAGPADLRHRRHLDLARCGRVHRARRGQRAGLHGGDALRLSHRRPISPTASSNWMDEKGYATLDDIRGRAVPNVTDWKYLNLKYDIKARIDQDKCIQCGLCHIACEDTSHQAIMQEKDGVRHFEVVDSECVGCNLCMHVCPVEQCITMERVDAGEYANWTTHPNNPARVVEEESAKAA